MICATLFHSGHLLFTWKIRCGLKLYFDQFDRSEICAEVSFNTPRIMWTLIIKLPHTELKFQPNVKSQTSLSSLQVSCKRALSGKFRSSRPETFWKKDVLSNFAKFKVKHMCQSHLFNKVAGLRFWHRCFPVIFMKFVRPPIFIEHLWWLLQ